MQIACFFFVIKFLQGEYELRNNHYNFNKIQEFYEFYKVGSDDDVFAYHW